MICQVRQIDNITDVVGDQFDEVIDCFDDRVMLQPIGFEDLVTQHAE